MVENEESSRVKLNEPQQSNVEFSRVKESYGRGYVVSSRVK